MKKNKQAIMWRITPFFLLVCAPTGAQTLRDQGGRRQELRDRVQQRADEIRGAEADVGEPAAGGSTVSTTIDPNAGISANTRVLVKLDEALDSSKHPQGYRFTGTLQADVISGDALTARRGSTVHGRVIGVRQPGRIGGQSYLDLALTGVMVGDRLRSIESTMLKVESGRTGADTLRKTAAGTAIGALADGSGGAGVGAKIGGGASILSRGQTASLSGGTTLEFLIGEPGSGLANQSSETITQPQETTVDRIRERRDARTGRRR